MWKCANPWLQTVAIRPAELHIIQQPFEQMPSLQSVTKVDGLIWTHHGNYVRWISLLQNRCYSLRRKSASEWHLGDLCKNLGPLRCNRQICIVVNVRDGSLWILKNPPFLVYVVMLYSFQHFPAHFSHKIKNLQPRPTIAMTGSAMSTAQATSQFYQGFANHRFDLQAQSQKSLKSLSKSDLSD